MKAISSATAVAKRLSVAPKTRRIAPGASPEPVKQRQCHPTRVSPNTLRLRAVVHLFRLSQSEIAKASGFSRSYVAMVLSPNNAITGSPEFYRALETKLGDVINARASQFFTVRAVPVARARDILEQLPVDEVAVEAAMERAA